MLEINDLEFLVKKLKEIGITRVEIYPERYMANKSNYAIVALPYDSYFNLSKLLEPVCIFPKSIPFNAADGESENS